MDNEPSENGVSTIGEIHQPIDDASFILNEQRIVVDGTAATHADYIELFKANPGLAQALTVVVQKRLLTEKDIEIEELKKNAYVKVD